MRPVFRGLALILVFATASCATVAPRDKLSGEARLAKLVEGRVAGKSTSCIRLSDVQGSEVVEGVAIVYRMPGDRLFVNRPRSGASTLREYDVLVTKTYGGDLCAPDVVNLVDPGSHFPRGFVILGPFVPYSKAAR